MSKNSIKMFDSVTALRFGKVWLVNDGVEAYWTTGRAIQSAHRYESDKDSGYDRWCQDTRALGFLPGSIIGDPNINDSFVRECMRQEKKIEAVGGYEYRLLAQ